MPESNCPDCGYGCTEAAGARIEADPADLAMMRVREDAEVLRRHSTHHSEFILAAIARAAAAQALMIERLTWAVEELKIVAEDAAHDFYKICER